MSLTLPQTVTGNKTFVDTLRIACQASLITQTIILDGDLNGVDLEIFAQSVWIDGRENQILGIKTFAANTTLGEFSFAILQLSFFCTFHSVDDHKP